MTTKLSVRKENRKKALKAAIRSHRKALERESHLAAERLLTFGKNMAVAGGILYVGYTVLDRYLDSKMRTPKTDTGTKDEQYATLKKMLWPVLALALQQGSLVMLRKARNMLIAYLEEKENTNV